MKNTVVSWNRSHSVDVPRSRAYKKNEQAVVEQKNGAIVRYLVGYERFEGIVAPRWLACLRPGGCTSTSSSLRLS